MSEHSAEAPKHHENPKESTITLSKDTIYGGAVAVLACLLVLAVFTQGFGVIKAPAQQCPQCLTCNSGINGTSSNGTGSTGGAAACNTPPTLSTPPPLGQANASITITEYSDYQCPYCARFYTGAEASLRQNYVSSGKVNIYFKDFPLSGHPNAMPAAMAVRCANEQGKFWEMHDKIFETQASWSGGSDVVATFKGYAADLGLDAAKFACCYDNYAAQVRTVINAELSAGQAAGVGGTPASFITIPKSMIGKDVLEAQINATNAALQGELSFSESGDNYVVLVPGAYPYSAFDDILSKVSQ